MKSSSDERHDQKLEDAIKDLQKNHMTHFLYLCFVFGPEFMLMFYMKALSNHLIKPPDLPQFKNKKPSKSQMDSMSPCKVADTRGKYFSQLHDLKSLLESGI